MIYPILKLIRWLTSNMVNLSVCTNCLIWQDTCRALMKNVFHYTQAIWERILHATILLIQRNCFCSHSLKLQHAKQTNLLLMSILVVIILDGVMYIHGCWYTLIVGIKISLDRLGLIRFVRDFPRFNRAIERSYACKETWFGWTKASFCSWDDW